MTSVEPQQTHLNGAGDAQMGQAQPMTAYNQANAPVSSNPPENLYPKVNPKPGQAVGPSGNQVSNDVARTMIEAVRSGDLERL